MRSLVFLLIVFAGLVSCSGPDIEEKPNKLIIDSIGQADVLDCGFDSLNDYTDSIDLLFSDIIEHAEESYDPSIFNDKMREWHGKSVCLFGFMVTYVEPGASISGGGTVYEDKSVVSAELWSYSNETGSKIEPGGWTTIKVRMEFSDHVWVEETFDHGQLIAPCGVIDTTKGFWVDEDTSINRQATYHVPLSCISFL